MTVSAQTQITELRTDDHACLTFGESEELLDLTAAFVRDGLSCGCRVVWLSELPADQAIAELAKRGVAVEPALTAGHLTATASENHLLSGQAFTAGHAMQWLGAQVADCQDRSLAGLRVVMDMSWALRPITGVEQLPDFEVGMASVLSGMAVCTLCQYDRERFDPVTLASAAALHTRSVAAATYYQDAVLRICRQYAPPGLRLAGEIDYHAAEPLALAIAEAIRLDCDIVVNMADLTFIDGACIRMICTAATSLAWPRRVILRCPPVIADCFVRYGAAQVPSVRLAVIDER